MNASQISIAEPTASAPSNGYRAVEFFAGVGGFAMSWPEVEVAAAIDIHTAAAELYCANFKHPFWIREIESIATEEIAALQANLWWLSPPCQPYTLRGQRRDVADPRARSLLRLISAIRQCLPQFLVLENVAGFKQSSALQQLIDELTYCRYRWQTIDLCPTQMGWPNKRLRFYLIASRGADIAPWSGLPDYACRTTDLVDCNRDEQNVAPELMVSEQTIATIEKHIDRCDHNSGRATACFASSYGRALLNSGSYWQLRSGRYRRFAPREVANLLGYPPTFELPEACRTRTLWKLLGNSLSLPAVRYVLSHLPAGPTPRLPWR